MKKLLLILLPLVASLLLLSCSDKKEPLVFATHDIAPPFAYIDSENSNELVGFDIEIAKIIAKDLDRELKIRTMSFDELIPAVANGEIDMALCSITITDERKKLVDFSISYYEASQVAMVRKDDNTFRDIKTKEELGLNKKLSSLVGSTCIDTAFDIAQVDNVVGADSWSVAIDHLLNRDVDAVIIDKIPARIFSLEYDNIVVLNNVEFDSEYYGVVVGKGNVELLASINNTISKIINSGEYSILIEKYIIAN